MISNLKTKYTFIVQNSAKRLDQLLVEYFEELEDCFSRSLVQKLISDTHILVNKKPSKSSYKVKIGDEVEISIPPRQEITVLAENVDLRIVYEDDYLIVINKDNNIVVHPAPGHKSGTLLNAVLHHTKGKISSIGAPSRYGIVHRIDKQTTGLIVLAKDDYTHLDLARQFSSKSAYRKYWAIVMNNPTNLIKTNKIETLFARHPNDRKKFSSKVKYGKKAITFYKLIKTNGELSLLDVELKTGRTHQIRVHFFDNNCPLIGDPLYKTKLSTKYPIDRQALHARFLSFLHPIYKIRISFSCRIEQDLQNIVRSM